MVAAFVATVAAQVLSFLHSDLMVARPPIMITPSLPVLALTHHGGAMVYVTASHDCVCWMVEDRGIGHDCLKPRQVKVG